VSSFEHLRDFIQKRMRMYHVYQPVMIRELLKHGGKASSRNIAAAFLARVASQLEYYEQARDDEDFPVIREGINERGKSDYIFCQLQPYCIIASNALALAIRDNYPVTGLHTLVIPKRHATTFFDLFEPERRAINRLLDGLRAEKGRFGERLQHSHEQWGFCWTDYWPCPHLIPRRQGDVPDPRGGVRGAIPDKARLLKQLHRTATDFSSVCIPIRLQVSSVTPHSRKNA
jgi:diadenosine tetraphosphate (Ap4A) HIT family hydrolase